MAQQNITGDLNVTGMYKQNGTALVAGTKLYKHVITNAYEGAELTDVGTLVVISTSENPVTATQELCDLLDNSIGISSLKYGYLCHLVLNSWLVLYISFESGSKSTVTIWDDCSFQMVDSSVDTVTAL